MPSSNKLILSLINRIAIRLPINASNNGGQRLEQDPIIQQTVAAIIQVSQHKMSTVVNALGTVLENISKHIPMTSPSFLHMPMDVLQSQLFILRLMSACMQHDWKRTIATATTTPQLLPVKKGNEISNDDSSKELPSPLDEALVSFILNSLSHFLNLMQMVEEANDAYFSDNTRYLDSSTTGGMNNINGNNSNNSSNSSGGDSSSNININNNNKYTSKPLDPKLSEIVLELYQVSGSILHYISACSWSSYYSKIKIALQKMGATMDPLDKRFSELRLFEFAHLDKETLHLVFTEMSPSFLHMKLEGKLLFATMVRKAIWRWIETYPGEFRQVCASENRLLAGSEILFDLCSSSADTPRKKAALWPLQTVLLVLAPDLLLQAFLDNPSSKNRRTSFLGTLRQSLRSARTSEIAAICYVDLCKAATYVPPTEESVLRHITADIEDELAEQIWNIAQATTQDNNTNNNNIINSTYDAQRLLTDYLLTRLQMCSTTSLKSLLTTYFGDDAPLVAKRALVKACLLFVQDRPHLSWNADVVTVYIDIFPYLAKLLTDNAASEAQGRGLMMMDITTTNQSSAKNIPSRSPGSNALSLDLLRLFYIAPFVPLVADDDRGNAEQFGTFLVGICNLCQQQDLGIRQLAFDCLIRFHDYKSMTTWGTSSHRVSNFWRISSQVVFCLARQILDTKQTETSIQSLLNTLIALLKSRHDFLEINLDYASIGMDIKERLKASVALEIACLISLCSTTPDVCSTALQCLSGLCKETVIAEEDTIHPQQQITLRSNLLIYNELVEQNDTSWVFGRKAQQKRMRKYLRMMSHPTPGVMAAWEEGWIRWKMLTQVILRFGEDILDDGRFYTTTTTTTTTSLSSSSAAATATATTTTTSNASSKKAVLGRHDKLRGVTSKPVVPVSRLEVDEEKQTLWQNYAGFLAALGGCCLKANRDVSPSPSSTTSTSGNSNNTQSDSTTINTNSSSTTKGHPQQVHSEPAAMVEKFISEMIELLTTDNVVVREGTKDALGNDLAPPLYAILSRHLEAVMSRSFNSDGAPICTPAKSLFVEQSMSVLKLILDRLVGDSQYLINIDFGTLVSYFTTYIGGLRPGYATTRMKINLCLLAEAMILKKDQIIIGNETWLRNRLLETFMEWTSDYALQSTNKSSMSPLTSPTGNSQDEKIQRDLDSLCMKTMAALSNQLPMQAITDAGHEKDTLQLKSRLFYKYITFFTKVLYRCHHEEKTTRFAKAFKDTSSNDLACDFNPDLLTLKENTILTISNLLSANVDIGLKHTLTLGAYHEDPHIRIAFIQVLTNILYQGTEFDSLAESATSDRYEKLVDLLFESDMEITLSLCHVCPAADTAETAKILLHCFKVKNKLLPLLDYLIDKEVKTTDNEAELFRGTNMATQLLSSAAAKDCHHYVCETLQPALAAINSLPDDQLTWELNPQKLVPGETISTNQKNVTHVADVLLDTICSSTDKAPMEFRQQLSMIVDAVRRRFPESKYTAVGGFVFLRLFCVAALAPEKHGFSDDVIPRNRNVRKILLQANRVIQNLSSNILFGSKDSHMVVMNDFLTNNIYKVTTFLREISQVQTGNIINGDLANSAKTITSTELNQRTYEQLHRCLYDNLDRISRDLSGRRARSYGGYNVVRQPISGQWKLTLDKLTKVLAELGRPGAPIQEDAPTFLKNTHAVSRSNHDFSEFMRRNSHRDVSSIKSLNCIYQGGVSRVGNPTFYVIAHLITPDVDFESLVFYLLSIMEPYLDKPFDIILDATRMNPVNEIPVHWINTLFQLIFQEMNDNLTHLYIFNPNSHLQRYIRKIPLKITNRLLKKTRFAITVAQLQEGIAPSEIRLPKLSVELEKELGTVFYPVSKIITMNIRIPVIVRVGEEHLQVTTVREQEIFFSINTKLNDVYHISDIDEVYSLPSSKSTDGNDGGGELIIKHDGGRSLTAFSSTKRDALVELFLQNKKRYEATRLGGVHDRTIRPNDVPGRLLNMALLNIGSDDPNLRLAAYNLLYSLNSFFRFDTGNRLLQAKDLCIPENNTEFIVSISSSLASTETHLTFEFIQECVDGFTKSNQKLRILCLDYLSPWLKNLALFCCGGDRDVGLAKIMDILRLLINLTLDRPEIYKHVQAKVWGALAVVDELIDPVLDILIQFSVEKGVASPESEAMGDTLVTMASIPVRGKIINRLRRVIQKSSAGPFRSLVECPAWTEIAVLLRFLLMLSFNIYKPMTPYLPEVFHIVSLMVYTGSPLIRTTVHKLVVNIIHALCTNRKLPDEKRNKLRYLLDDLCDGDARHHFGLLKTRTNPFTITQDSTTTSYETVDLASLESVVRLLLEVMAAGAVTADISNAWRARWMGLVASTSFQFNPAIQPRSFVVLGCLAHEGVDDDLMYQILVAMRGALIIFNDTNPSLITSIMMCLTNIIDSLPPDTQYLSPMFWLAIALIQMGHPATFSTATRFLQAVLHALDARKLFAHRSVVDVMMEIRQPFADIAMALDKETGVSFNTNFSFALATILLKGVKHSEPRDLVFQCLTTFLEIECKRSMEHNVVEAGTLGYFAGLLPFAAQDGALRELLRLAGIDDIDLDALEFGSAYVRLFDTLEIPNNTTALLLVSTLMNILNTSETDLERVFLYSFLSEAAIAVPEVFSLIYESLLPKMNQIMVSSQNHAVLDAVKNLLMSACAEPIISNRTNRRSQKSYLDELGFSALGDPTFGSSNTKHTISLLASELLERITS
ncbi:hypothetical protein BC941DRAFT_429713 [Chlamydoabsidia padenii]|nr:hypothetical protein BC941DRAFT_429713 [Chlamydoabsidia padenii]